ncbi:MULTISPECIES: anti-sigma factor [unclassified Knoellia]|uniref:anti-sigma factor n=1 Tax=Knoellia altitudinis TaxID=3404795 RepID=UPI00361F4E27
MRIARSPSDGHIADDRLVDLALDATASGPEDAHLGSCSLCADFLASLVRTVAVTREAAQVEIVPPRRDLWASIDAEVLQEGQPDVGVGVRADRVAPRNAAPRPSSTRAASRGDDVVATPRRRPALAWLAAACAAGVLLGVGGSVVAERFSKDEPVPTTTVATAQLDTLDTRQWLGSAAVVERGGGVNLEVTAQVRDPGDGYIEVWLLNRDGKRMVSVGVLGWPGEPGSFSISRRLLDEGYVVVDISREQFDDRPQHSGESIVRGTLTTPG